MDFENSGFLVDFENSGFWRIFEEIRYMYILYIQYIHIVRPVFWSRGRHHM